MNNQGLFGALEQYWRVEPKARLNRRNTYFEDVTISEYHLLAVATITIVMVIGTMAFFIAMGVMGV